MNTQNIKTMDCQSCFAGLNTSVKCLALVQYMERRGLLQLLVDEAIKAKPRLDI